MRDRLLFVFLVPMVLFLVVVMLFIFTTAPGACLLTAGDCLSDGSCDVSVTMRYGARVSAAHRGGSAYLQGVLFLLLSVLLSYLAAKAITDAARALRPRRRRREPDDPQRVWALRLAATIAYLLIDTALVYALVRWLDGA